MPGNDTQKRLELRIDCEGEDDDFIDALAKKHSKQIPPEPPPPPQSPPLPGWDTAIERTYEDRDTKPLAAMVHSNEPMPPWVRNQLAHLLDPEGGYSVGEDRLVFTRTPRVRAKVDTQKTNFRIGQAVLDAIDAGKTYAAAVKSVAEKERRTDDSSVKKVVSAVRKLPPNLRPSGRKR